MTAGGQGSRRSTVVMRSVARSNEVIRPMTLLLRAVAIYELDRLDFAEAYLVACAETSGP